MCKAYCQVTLLWKNAERAGRDQCQLTVQMNDWDIRTTTNDKRTINERYKNDHVSWSHLLVGQLFGRKKKTAKMVKKKKKKKQPVQPEGSFRDAVFIPRASNEELLKSILYSNENDNVLKFQFRFAWNARLSPAFGQRTSVDQLAQLSVTGFFSWRGLIQQRAFEVHSFGAG